MKVSELIRHLQDEDPSTEVLVVWPVMICPHTGWRVIPKKLDRLKVLGKTRVEKGVRVVIEGNDSNLADGEWEIPSQIRERKPWRNARNARVA